MVILVFVLVVGTTRAIGSPEAQTKHFKQKFRSYATLAASSNRWCYGLAARTEHVIAFREAKHFCWRNQNKTGRVHLPVASGIDIFSLQNLLQLHTS